MGTTSFSNSFGRLQLVYRPAGCRWYMASGLTAQCLPKRAVAAPVVNIMHYSHHSTQQQVFGMMYFFRVESIPRKCRQVGSRLRNQHPPKGCAGDDQAGRLSLLYDANLRLMHIRNVGLALSTS